MGKFPFIVDNQSLNLVTGDQAGLGNRIIPMGCLLCLASELNYQSAMFWIADPVIGRARFADLFSTSNLPFKLVEGCQADFAGTVMLSRSFRQNWPRRILSKVTRELFTNRYDVVKISTNEQHGQFRDSPAADLLKYRRIMLSAPSLFRYDCDISWLKPAEPLAHRVTELKKQFSPNTVGIHFRGTKDARGVPATEKMIARMRAEIELDPNVKFFFAWDRGGNGQRIIDLFGARIIRNTIDAPRNSIQGQQDAVVDLFGLASTSRIIGFQFSSFALTAAFTGSISFLRI